MHADDNDLDGFFAAASELDQAALLALTIEPSASEAAARGVARAMARRRAASLGIRDKLLRVEGEIIRWTGAAGARSGVWTGGNPARDLVLADIRRRAAPALMDAAIAIVLGNALDEPYREVLLAPWERSVDHDAAPSGDPKTAD